MTQGHPAEEETARLRAEVDRLRAEATRPRAGWWRPLVVAVLLTLLAVLVPAAVVATWARDQVGDTDRYVETMAPLASDPAVQRAIGDRVTEEIFARLDVEAITREAVTALEERGLPPRLTVGLAALTTPLAAGVRDYVHTQVARLVASEQFEIAWVEANRAAHDQVVAVVTGRTGEAVEVSGSQVNINLAAIINAVKAQLTDAGFALAERIPTVEAQFTVLESADVARAQAGFRALEASARVLPIAALLVLAGAVAAGRDRRRTLVLGALVVAGSMLLLGALLNLARGIYLANLPDEQLSPAAAAAVFDALVRFIRTNLRALALLFLAVAAATWVTGPGNSARAVRQAGGDLLERGKRVVDGRRPPGPVAHGVWRHRAPIRTAVLALALVAYVGAAHPTGAYVLALLVVTGIALLLVEVVARPPVLQQPQ